MVEWVALALAVGGCGHEKCVLVEGCPPVDAAGGPDDFTVSIGGGTIVTMVADGHTWVWSLKGGEAVFTTEPRNCDFAITECEVTVKRLELRFGDMTLELSNDTKLEAKNIVLSLATPVTATSTDNFDFVVAAGNTFQTCAVIDGKRAHGVAAPTGEIVLEIARYPREIFGVRQRDAAGTEIVLHAGEGNECDEVRVKLHALNTGGAFVSVPEP